MTHTYTQAIKQPTLHYLTRSVRRRAATSKRCYRSSTFARLIPRASLLGRDSDHTAKMTVAWMTAVILSHIFVLGYGWFFVDALMVMCWLSLISC